MGWRDMAACKGDDTIDWVPTRKGPGGSDAADRANLAAARRLCAVCPVRGCCLDEALRDHLGGIWAGTTSKERRAIRRRHGSHDERMSDLLTHLEREAR